MPTHCQKMDALARSIFTTPPLLNRIVMQTDVSNKQLHMILRDIYCRGFVILFGDCSDQPFLGSHITNEHTDVINTAMLCAGIKVHSQVFDIDIFKHLLECAIHDQRDSGIPDDDLRRASMIWINIASLKSDLPLEDYSMTINISDQVHMIRFSLVFV